MKNRVLRALTGLGAGAGLLQRCAPAIVALALVGCALPERPNRPDVFDFGPGGTGLATATATATTKPGPVRAALAPLALADIEAGPALDGTALWYRLNYADAQQLRPYAQARWSMAPAQLVRQRLRERLSQQRTVVNAGEGALIDANPWLLRLELEEFSQLFDSPTASFGWVRLRATAVQPTPQGEKLLGQRSFAVRRPAPTPDAPGGVRALTLATDAAIDELDQWLQQLQPVRSTP